MTGVLWAVVRSPIALQPRFFSGSPTAIILQYGVEFDQWEHLIGASFDATVLGECWNDRVQAIALSLPNWVPCQHPHPHLVISWIKEANPVEANLMLATEHQSAPLEFSQIPCLIEFQDWGKKPLQPRQWRDRPAALCPTCLRQGKKTWTRSLTGYCRKHRPNPKKPLDKGRKR